MALRGADIDKLRDLANRLQNTWGSQIDQLISQIDTQVQASASDVWIGPDADQFRNQIWPQHKAALKAARQALADAGATAKRNADVQETTSSSVA